MAMRRAGVHALAQRCRMAGWEVDDPTGRVGGYKVRAKNGYVKVLHLTSSDSNALMLMERDLDQLGNLHADEKAAEADRAAAKATKAKAAKAAAAARLAKAAKETCLTNKAAGPYAGPEEIEQAWFLKEHPAPWMRWAIITPAIAAALLERNSDNRKFRPSTTAYYRKQIEAEGWYLTHQGMAMDTRGIFQDGQHRALACIEAGKPFSAPFFVGMNPLNFKYIDDNRRRSAADLFGKDDEARVEVLQAAVRLIAATREPYPKQFMSVKTPISQIYDSFKGDPERLREAVQWGKAHAKPSRMSATALAAGWYLLRDANGETNAYVAAFLNGLVTGMKDEIRRIALAADDPRLALREDMQTRRERRQRTNAIEQLGLILWAWNCVASGRRAKHVKWADFGNDIPTVVLCRDKGRNSSALPDLLVGEVPE